MPPGFGGQHFVQQTAIAVFNAHAGRLNLPRKRADIRQVAQHPRVKGQSARQAQQQPRQGNPF
jgi:hypothetical protein